MRRALDLAALGPRTGPNPRVGCVLLDDRGRTVSEGHHRGAGTPHAEAAALAALAGDVPRGLTAVATLEPCTHTGRTGPCAQALLGAGVRRVVVAALDPNPAAAGGVQLLRSAGVEVETGVLAAEGEELNERWSTAVGRGRPWVTWKWAATLDGRSAAADGSSRWITGEQARTDVHRLRGEHDAVLVGTGTALTDDPALTVRDAQGRPAARQPLRVVVGRRELPAAAALHDGAAPLLHLRTDDLTAALAQLHDREVRTVLVEGGPTLAAALWRAGLVDEVVAYLAPALLGAGPAAVGDLGIGSIDAAARLHLRAVDRVGDDVRLTARPGPPGPTPPSPTPSSSSRPTHPQEA
ncbi:bifunctional diaminohydroxyphosphoribosylaminopyrimidine deaminase/5-amino-6-(5-phosphoribosylamino)uracil reductase RibD [Kineococcus xinjiangensis]